MMVLGERFASRPANKINQKNYNLKKKDILFDQFHLSEGSQ